MFTMKATIIFHASSKVEDYTVDIDILPRLGDFLHLPDADSRNLCPIERVAFVLAKTQPIQQTLEMVRVRIYLEAPVPQAE